jgi:RNA polymerase sigma factor (sigma-70 family)
MPDATTDLIRGWLERHVAGENPPRAELLGLCQERIRLMVRPRLRSFPDVSACEETDDILNQVLFRLHNALDDVRPASPLDLMGFCAELIRRVLLDVLKSARRRHLDRTYSLNALGEADGFDPANGTDHPIDSDTLAEFHRYVGELPPEEKVLFDLLYYAGLKVPAAAAALGVSPASLKKRWQVARIRAVERLGLDRTKSF